MGYTDILKEPQEMMNILFDKQELEIKRLKVQYADAYAHAPSTIQKRILRLNAIKELI